MPEDKNMLIHKPYCPLLNTCHCEGHFVDTDLPVVTLLGVQDGRLVDTEINATEIVQAICDFTDATQAATPPCPAPTSGQ